MPDLSSLGSGSGDAGGRSSAPCVLVPIALRVGVAASWVLCASAAVSAGWLRALGAALGGCDEEESSDLGGARLRFHLLSPPLDRK